MMPMSEGIFLELAFFGRAFVLGVAMMIFYGLLSLGRRVVRHSVWLVALEDLLYWLLAGVGIFRMLYLENNGAIRGFAICAVILGMLLCLGLEKVLNRVRKKLQSWFKEVIMSLK